MHKHPIEFFGNYRPQRSWGKVIFSEACVKNSVHGGGGGGRGCLDPGPGGSFGGLDGGISRPTPGESGWAGRWVSGSTPRGGGRLDGLAWGVVSRPTPRGC